MKVLSVLTALAVGGAIALPPVLFSPPAQAQTSCPLFKLGSQGVGVTTLQRQLANLGYLDAHLVTGYYGQPTLQAVSRFQAVEGLWQDGVAGPQTLTLLNLCGAGGETDPTRLSFSEVQALQARLVALGYDPGGIDGIAGQATAQALLGFQRDYQYPSDRQASRTTLNQVNTAFNQVCRGRSRSVPLTDPLGRVPASSLGVRTCIVYEPQPRPLPPNPVETPTVSRYVIAIPGEGWELLNQVRRYVPDAFQARDSRGPYIQAGVHPNRAIADRWESYLRQQRLDARVIYQN